MEHMQPPIPHYYSRTVLLDPVFVHVHAQAGQCAAAAPIRMPRTMRCKSRNRGYLAPTDIGCGLILTAGTTAMYIIPQFLRE